MAVGLDTGGEVGEQHLRKKRTSRATIGKAGGEGSAGWRGDRVEGEAQVGEGRTGWRGRAGWSWRTGWRGRAGWRVRRR